ncbi:unnamed protein product [Lampetra fluviatilis]
MAKLQDNAAVAFAPFRRCRRSCISLRRCSRQFHSAGVPAICTMPGVSRHFNVPAFPPFFLRASVPAATAFPPFQHVGVPAISTCGRSRTSHSGVPAIFTAAVFSRWRRSRLLRLVCCAGLAARRCSPVITGLPPHIEVRRAGEGIGGESERGP